METDAALINFTSGRRFGQDKPVILLPANTGRVNQEVVANTGPFAGETFIVARSIPLERFELNGVMVEAWQMRHTAEQAPTFDAKHQEITDAKIAAAQERWDAKPACGCCGVKADELFSSSRHGKVCIDCFTRNDEV